MISDNINGTPVVKGYHLGEGYESYRMVKHSKYNEFFLFEKNLTDNSNVYDIVIKDSDDHEGECVVLSPTSKVHALKVFKTLEECC